MFGNYIKVAFRSLRKQKGYAIINILGLALGIASCAVIYLYVQYEFGFDSFHANGDHIYCTTYRKSVPESDLEIFGSAHVPAGPMFKSEIPEVEDYVRIWQSRDIVRAGTESYSERLTFADPSLFDVFSFPLQSRVAENVLGRPDAVVLTETTARRFFGDQPAVGQTISVQLGLEFYEFTVTAVALDIPSNSSITFDVLLPLSRVVEIKGPQYLQRWGREDVVTYVLLDAKADPAVVTEKMTASAGKVLDADGYTYSLRSLSDVHLDSEWFLSVSSPNEKQNILILSAIALLVLLTACGNFMNLSIARYAGRVEEIGLRKVVGASRYQLMIQFWVEAIVLSFIALGIGIVLAELFLPAFNSLAGRRLHFDFTSDPWLALALVALGLITGFLAGSYPALLLSRFNPVAILRDRLKVGGAHIVSRVMVVGQFALCVFLVLTAIVMTRQVSYMKTRDLGFNDELLLLITSNSPDGGRVFKRYREAVRHDPSILAMSATDAGLTGSYSTACTLPLAVEFKYALVYQVDEDFLRTTEVELLEGRDFDVDLATDRTNAVIVNESMVQDMGWVDPVGEQFQLCHREHEVTVIGVVRDFHCQPMQYPISPVVLHMDTAGPVRYFYLRVDGKDIASTLAFLERQWKNVAPGLPFEFHFIDDAFDSMYRAEERWNTIVRYSSSFALLIACLGLFGLSALQVRKRTREICIRKVHGAGSGAVARLVGRNFLILVAIACLIGWPVGYYVMNRWLQGFAYHVNIGAQAFIASGLFTVIIALAAISYQVYRATRANPAEALRSE